MCAPIDFNSAEWQRLTEEVQYKLVEPIGTRFEWEFGAVPLVNYIGFSPRGIHVDTALPHGTRIEQIPLQYYGVPVKQTALREAMDEFIATWTAILDRIGGWPPERIAAHANDRHPCFRSMWFLHDSPIDWVAGLLLPEDLRHGRGIEPGQQVCKAIESGFAPHVHNWHPDQYPDYDWNAARNRVRAVIDQLRNENVGSGSADDTALGGTT
jgi:hypothetical protein